MQRISSSVIGGLIAIVAASLVLHGCSTAPTRQLRTELDTARSLAQIELPIVARIAALRTDDMLRGGVERNWIGPDWVRSRIKASDSELFDRITHVYLGGTTVTDSDIDLVARLPALRELYLHRTHVSDAALVSLARSKTLEVLHLAYTGVTDDGIQVLAGIPRLSTLYVNETKVTPEGAKHLRTKLPHTQIIE